MRRFVALIAFLAFFKLGSATLTVVRTLPINLSAGISVSPTLSIRFSENVSSNKDSCYINGILLKPYRITGTTVILMPNFLSYQTECKVDIPAGAFKSSATGELSPACSFTFTTEQRPATENRLFDAVVASDGSGNYTSIRAAVTAAPTARTKPWLIFVKKGIYTELIRIPADKPFIHLVGEDRDSTVLKFAINADASTPYGPANFPDAEGESPVLVVKGTDFYMENIRLVNAYGYDLQNGPMALALGSEGDRMVLNRSSLLSYQDTWQTCSSGSAGNRCYAKNCYVEGAVDFIYNAGDYYFDSCTLGLSRSGSYITAASHAGAAWGYIFMNCNIVSSKPGVARTDNYLGRPWQNNPKVRFINTTLSKDITIKPTGWMQSMGGLPLIFADYNTMDYTGKAVDLSQRNNFYYNRDTPPKTCYAQRFCTSEEVKSLTTQNVLNGTDGWRPDLHMPELEAPAIETATQVRVTWKANPWALCYLISKNNRFVRFTTSNYFDIDDTTADYTVKAVNEWGGLGSPTSFSSKTTTALHPISMNTPSIIDGRLYLPDAHTPAEVDVFGISGIRLTSFSLTGEHWGMLPAGRFLIMAVRQGDSKTVLRVIR
jgi:pectin methylesterase-like acyl-CoA thioesterase